MKDNNLYYTDCYGKYEKINLFIKIDYIYFKDLKCILKYNSQNNY